MEQRSTIKQRGAYFLISILSAFVFTSNAQTSSFTYTTNSPNNCAPVTITFANASTNANDYLWDFGNGNVSAVENPVATYLTGGSYTVTLTASNGGSSHVSTQVIEIHSIPTSNFSTNVSTVCAGQTATFIDNSIPGSGTINQWVWDFGDGNSETNATGTTTNTYLAPGTYPVSLITTNSFGCNHDTIITIDVLPVPVVSFTATPRSSCNVPTAVSFTNQTTSNGSATYLWDFGNGNTSTAENPPAEDYNSLGNYTVSLTATEQGCSSTSTQADYIVMQAITPDFTASKTSLCVNEAVLFTELAGPNSISRTWDFGDGTTSTDQHPTHSYAAPGNYTVTLRDVNGCTNNETKVNYITVIESPTLAFTADVTTSCVPPLTVTFTDNSVGAISWNWNFGDGSTSTAPNPVRTYIAEGEYNVSLQITSANGCTSDTIKNSYIVIAPTEADFEATPLSGCVPLDVDFTSTSTSPASPIVSYDWNFGNGVATTAIPTTSNTYAAENEYTVSLTVTALNGCTGTTTKVNYIKAGTPPTAAFTVVTPVICHVDAAEFTDESVGADSVHWEFDTNQGTFDTPEGAIIPFNPVTHNFPDTGSFYVKQVVFRFGCINELTKQNAVRVLPPKPLMAYELNCDNPYSVEFTDMSQGADSYTWDFGDGSPTVADQSPVTHVYGTRGLKTAILTATTNNSGTICTEPTTATFTIADPIAAHTIVDDTSCYDIAVNFTDVSQDMSSVLWDFGDGSLSASTPASHLYSTPGVYTMKHVITDINDCKDSTTKTIIVQGPIPDFSADRLFGCAPTTITFTDNSVSDSTLTNWTWDFGDGSPVEATTNPTISHTYTVPGIYSVTMTAFDKNGCDQSTTKFNYLDITFPTPVVVADTFACLNEVVNFDGVSGSAVAYPASFSWDFGDQSPVQSGFTPSHAYSTYNSYSVTLTITDRNNCVNSLVHPLHIQKPAAAFTYTVISETCGNSQLQFFDQSAGLGINQWEWDFGDLGSGAQQNPPHSYTTPGYYPVTLIATNVAGCKDTVIVDSIHVKGPIGSFSFTPVNGCVPHEVTFTASSQNATSFIWDFGDGVAETTSDSVTTHTYNLVSSPTPSLILSNMVNGLPCNFPATPAGRVFVAPSFSVNLTSKTDNTCFGQTNGIAVANVVGGTPPYSYSWSTTPTQTTSTATALAENTYTLTASGVYGCTGQLVVNIDAPDQVITTGGINDSICPTLTSTLTASAVGGTGGYSYNWQPGNITNAGTLVVPNNMTSQTYTIIATDNSGCVGTIDSSAIKVFSLDDVQVQMLSNSPICVDRNAYVGAQLGLTGQITSYQWTPNIGPDEGPFTLQPTQATTYSLALTNICDSSYSDTTRVIFREQPTVLVSSDSSTLCYKEQFQFISNSFTLYPNDPITNWQWTFGDEASATGYNPSHTYTASGPYNVGLTVTTDSGCINSTGTNPYPVTAYPYPTSIFKATSNILSIPIEKLTIENSSINSVTQTWNFGDGGTSSDFAPIHEYTKLGNYTVTNVAINQYSCKDTSQINIETRANLVFPNAFTPNKEFSSGGVYDASSLDNDVFFPLTADVIEYDLKIFNSWGEIIFSTNDVNQGWDGYYQGVLVHEDVYVWSVRSKYRNGIVIEQTGDVTVLLK